MKHVSRTRRVALDSLFDRIVLDPTIHIKYVVTQNRFADVLTKGSFTRDEWNHLLRLFNITNISMSFCSHFNPSQDPQAMSKRLIQEGKPGDKQHVVAKSKHMRDLVSKIVDRSPTAMGSSASYSLGTLKAQSSNLYLTSTGNLAARD